jgi:hypothetical protein
MAGLNWEDVNDVMLPVVSYGSATWSVTLRLFENGVLREVVGCVREEVTGEWRKLQNEELHDLYCSPNITCLMKSRMDGQGMWHFRCKSEISAGLWCGNVEEKDIEVNACKVIVQTGWYCAGWRDISPEINFGMLKMRRISLQGC